MSRKCINSIILRKHFLTRCKVEFAPNPPCLGYPQKNSQPTDSRRTPGAGPPPQRAHPAHSQQPHPNPHTPPKTAPAAAPASRMLATRETLQNIFGVLLNLIKRLMFVKLKDCSPTQFLNS